MSTHSESHGPIVTRQRPPHLPIERTLLLVLLGCCLLSATGCPAAHRCSVSEICNGLDDDCDGQRDEGFLDAQGRYFTDAHCGGCDLSCDAVFPTAERTRCSTDISDGPSDDLGSDEADTPTSARCELVSCPAGSHQQGHGLCVPDQASLCMPCATDGDCDRLTPGSRCLSIATQARCGTPCGVNGACPANFECDISSGQCLPDPGKCACSREPEESSAQEVRLGCLVPAPGEELFCAGTQSCGPDGLGECAPTDIEICNGLDDDCDGQRDEGLVDSLGRYVSRQHCGDCASPCVEPGPNTVASCEANGSDVSCEVRCEERFRDVDGISANGCECALLDLSSAPVVGLDADCDGLIDDDDSYVHVAPRGNDQNPGTVLAPLRSISGGLALGARSGKVVLVSGGSYEPFEVVPGTRLFGGYRPDFRERDLELYPVVVEAPASADGTPVLRCSGIRQDTTIAGLTLLGDDADSLGRGSTVVLSDGCGAEVQMLDLTIFAGRGADGQAGAPASTRLPAGFSSLDQLEGADGDGGVDGDDDSETCQNAAGGRGGQLFCGDNASLDVSGGSGGAAWCQELGCSNASNAACANAGCTDFTVNGICDIDRVMSLATPNPPAAAGRGTGGGQGGVLTYNAPTNRGICSFCDDNPTLRRGGDDGQDGSDGINGLGGSGCTRADLFDVDASGRVVSLPGSAGSAGSAGSGGGGGSAGAGYAVIRGTTGFCNNNAGGSGGGGGSGGCAAPSGGAGSGGGSSVGLVVIPVSGQGPRLDNVRVVTASGGRGGDGGNGAAGGAGGVGAAGGRALFWCARAGGRGGDGGDGGNGGGGGGGCGGSTHAAVLIGEPGDYRETLSGSLLVERGGVAGQGGQGGFSPGQPGSAGASGADTPVR